jgi:Ca2+/Na+ antiporter
LLKLVETGKDGGTRLSRRDVPFSLVAIVLFILILAVFVFYIYRNETLLIIALLLLIILALSLRLIRAMNLFRPRRQQSQVNHSKNCSSY